MRVLFGDFQKLSMAFDSWSTVVFGLIHLRWSYILIVLRSFRKTFAVVFMEILIYSNDDLMFYSFLQVAKAARDAQKRL
jgi:hypothetical protein